MVGLSGCAAEPLLDSVVGSDLPSPGTVNTDHKSSSSSTTECT